MERKQRKGIMKVKTALVGINGYAKVHLNNLQRLVNSGKIALSAAVVLPHERTPENTAYFESVGCRVFGTLDEMFAQSQEKPDLVCIPTGIASHEPLTKCCLAHGANVLVEKPAAGSLAAVDRMRQAEADSGKFVAIGFQHIYSPELQSVKRDLLAGKFGCLKSISVMGIWPRADAYYSRNSWAGKLKTASGDQVLDSPANNAFAHYLNLPLFFTGTVFGRSGHPVEVTGQLYRARKSIESFDTCGIQLKTEEGIPIHAYFSHASLENHNPEIRIECEKAVLTLDFGDNVKRVCTPNGTLLEEGRLPAAHVDMFRDVMEKVSDRSVFTCTLDIAREHTFCIEELHRHCQVMDIPEHLLSVEEESGQFVVRDLYKTFRDCFLTGKKLIF